ncbi:MAG: hypothetical protein ABW148_00465 [Sedimenticola sp.]
MIKFASQYVLIPIVVAVISGVLLLGIEYNFFTTDPLSGETQSIESTYSDEQQALVSECIGRMKERGGRISYNLSEYAIKDLYTAYTNTNSLILPQAYFDHFEDATDYHEKASYLSSGINELISSNKGFMVETMMKEYCFKKATSNNSSNLTGAQNAPSS